jgi:hypothetical protein
LLRERRALTLGARAFADALRGSRMRVYEVTAVVPGASITLMDLAHGSTVTVAERSTSMTVRPSDLLAARVLTPGASGKPEMERGLLPIPALYRSDMMTKVSMIGQSCALGEGDLSKADHLRFVHNIWAGSVLDPSIPALHDTDGDSLAFTRMHWEMNDRASFHYTRSDHVPGRVGVGLLSAER